MQYTSKKPHHSSLIVRPDGLRYRFQLDHVFKEIRYAQVKGIKIKSDGLRIYFMLIAPLLITGHVYSLLKEGLSVINGLNLSFWILVFLIAIFVKKSYTLIIQKAGLEAEVYITNDKKEARRIKKEIESHL